MATDSDIESLKAASGDVAVPGAGGSRPSRRLFHAGSGAAILGIDWLLFSGNILSGGIGTLLAMALGFVLGGLSVGLIQRFVAGDSVLKSLGKGLVAGLVVGAPTPVAGTALGGVILTTSGLLTSGLKSKLGRR